MRWTTVNRGDRRVARRFAWLPVELENGKTVWLERYTAEQEWYNGGDPFNGSMWYWRTTRAYQ